MKNATVSVPTDTYIIHRQTKTDLIICPMLWYSMGQIIIIIIILLLMH